MCMVRDYESGDLGVMEGMLGDRRGWAGWLYPHTFPFGAGKSSLVRLGSEFVREWSICMSSTTATSLL